MIARVFTLIHDNCIHHFFSNHNQLEGGVFFSGDNSRPKVVKHHQYYKTAEGNEWKVLEGVVTTCKQDKSKVLQRALFTMVGVVPSQLIDCPRKGLCRTPRSSHGRGHPFWRCRHPRKGLSVHNRYFPREMTDHMRKAVLLLDDENPVKKVLLAASENKGELYLDELEGNEGGDGGGNGGANGGAC
jgi:hypothetical protein